MEAADACLPEDVPPPSAREAKPLAAASAGMAAEPSPELWLDEVQEEESIVGFGKLGKGGKLGYSPALLSWGNGSGDVTVLGHRWPHSISTHPPKNGCASVRYRLPAQSKALLGAVGLNDSRSTCATALQFRVVVGGATLWASEPLRCSGVTHKFSVVLPDGASDLVLEVLCDGNNSNAHAVWLNPRLLTAAALATEEASVYLSSLAELRVHVCVDRPFGKNGTLGYKGTGGDRLIRVQGADVYRGLSTHPPANAAATVAYAIPDKFRTPAGQLGCSHCSVLLNGAVAFNDDSSLSQTWSGGLVASLSTGAVGGATPVLFSVHADEAVLWTSPPVRCCGIQHEFSITLPPLTKEMTLVVTCNGPADGCEAVWIDPRLTVTASAQPVEATELTLATSVVAPQLHTSPLPKRQLSGNGTEITAGPGALQQLQQRLPRSHTIFGSMRFPVSEEARALQLELWKHGVHLMIVDIRPGQDISTEVFEWIEYADTFMAFGESHYGEDTGNPASSCMEAKFAENLGKRTVLLRMIDWEEKFEHLQARVMFGVNRLTLFWLKGALMPPDLVQQLLNALQLPGAAEEVQPEPELEPELEAEPEAEAEPEPDPAPAPEREPEPEPEPKAQVEAQPGMTFLDLLRRLDVLEYASVLAEEEIRSEDDLRDLTMEELKELGFKLGSRKRVVKWGATGASS